MKLQYARAEKRAHSLNVAHGEMCVGATRDSSCELVARAQAGEAGALSRLLELHRPPLQRWASGRVPRYVCGGADTEDFVQDALVGTLRNLKAFEHRGDWALQAYLRRSVTNRVRDELRKFHSRPQRADIDDDIASAAPSPLEAAIDSQSLERYERTLARLSPLERKAVVARIELGHSYDEIAALVDKPSPDAARMLVSRALGKLTRFMTPSRQTASSTTPRAGSPRTSPSRHETPPASEHRVRHRAPEHHDRCPQDDRDDACGTSG